MVIFIQVALLLSLGFNLVMWWNLHKMKKTLQRAEFALKILRLKEIIKFRI